MTTCSSPRIVRLNARTTPVEEPERSLLAPLGGELVEIEGATDEEILDACRNADAILIVAAYLRAPVIRGLTRCRLISRMGTGIDKIDIEAATRKGIDRKSVV
jgi:D-3-phosphoglycerate dehydrogenase / 2-oxoglutarate reductase